MARGGGQLGVGAPGAALGGAMRSGKGGLACRDLYHGPCPADEEVMHVGRRVYVSNLAWRTSWQDLKDKCVASAGGDAPA